MGSVSKEVVVSRCVEVRYSFQMSLLRIFYLRAVVAEAHGDSPGL